LQVLPHLRGRAERLHLVGVFPGRELDPIVSHARQAAADHHIGMTVLDLEGLAAGRDHHERGTGGHVETVSRRLHQELHGAVESIANRDRCGHE
jgi:hypothetical protein